MVAADEREQRVKDFIKRFAWKGPVFRISALTREGCDALVTDIYDYLATQREQEQRAQTSIAEEALGIHSIDADDPRFKLTD